MYSNLVWVNMVPYNIQGPILHSFWYRWIICTRWSQTLVHSTGRQTNLNVCRPLRKVRPIECKNLELFGSHFPTKSNAKYKLFGINNAIIYANSINLNSSNKFQCKFNKLEFQQSILNSTWNNYYGNHRHRVDLLTQN